jgi:hypothetical protein
LEIAIAFEEAAAAAAISATATDVMPILDLTLPGVILLLRRLLRLTDDSSDSSSPDDSSDSSSRDDSSDSFPSRNLVPCFLWRQTSTVPDLHGIVADCARHRVTLSTEFRQTRPVSVSVPLHLQADGTSTIPSTGPTVKAAHTATRAVNDISGSWRRNMRSRSCCPLTVGSWTFPLALGL